MSVVANLPITAVEGHYPGGEQMEMGVVVTIAAMCVDHHDVATLQRLAPDLTIEIIQALHPAAPQHAQHDTKRAIQTAFSWSSP